MRCRLALAMYATLLVIGNASAQEQTRTNAPGGTERRVEIRRARTMKPLKVGGVTVMRLIDSVVLEHEGVLLHCDSAYVYQENNSFDAYGKVRIEGEGSLIRGEALYYEGATKSGRMTGVPVELVDTESGAYLWTDFLFFNTETESAYYVTGGRVETTDYRVLSRRGYYASANSRTTFSGDVVIRGTDVDMVGDSVELYRDVGRLRFFNRTRIYQDSSFLYGDSGVYDRESRKLSVLQNVSLRRGANTLFSDYLRLEQESGYALARGRAVLVDSTGDNRLYGHRVELWQKDDRVLATDSPLVYSVDTTSSPSDTLFLRADTLFAWRDTLVRGDTLQGVRSVDTVWYVRALHAVRAYSRGQQAVADSMYYNGLDSTVTLYRLPVPYVWKEDMQAYGKSIVGYLGDGRVDSVLMKGNVFVAQRDGASTYNQIYGQLVSARLDSTGVRFVRVREDGKVIFFMRDEGKLIGVNKVAAPAFNVWLEANSIQNVTFYSNAMSDVIPYKDAVTEDKVLPGYAWNDSLQPKRRDAVIPSWIGRLDYYETRRAAIAAWEAFDSEIFAIPWESGTSKIPKLPPLPEGLREGRSENAVRVEVE